MVEEPPKSQQPRTVVWLLFIVAGFVAIQILNRKPESLSPGPQRGDLVLEKQVLPDEIVGWKVQSFQPALPPEQLPDGQFWWTHAWNYSRGKLNALVAFDQADWTSWHELTICYQAIGWKLVDRKVIVLSKNAAVVVALLKRLPQEKATLVFSLFSQDGSLIRPPQIGVSSAEEEDENLSFTSLLNGRLTYDLPEGAEQLSEAETFERILQCQVFASHPEPLSEDEVHHLIELHLETLRHFRDAWLKRQASN